MDEIDKQDMKMSEQPSDHQPTNHQPLHKRHWFGKAALVVIVILVSLIVVHQTTKTEAAISSSQVSIQSSGFFPKVISINAGSTVAWTNYDSSPHQVSSDPYPKDDKLASLNSLALAPKDSFSYTFATKGTFTYHDNLNPYKLQGTVVVR